MAGNTLSVPEGVVAVLMTLERNPDGTKVFRFTQPAKDALAVHLPGTTINSGADHESIRRGADIVFVFVPEETDANAPENVLRTMVVVDREVASATFQKEVLKAMQLALQDIAPTDVGGRRRRTRRKRKTSRRRK